MSLKELNLLDILIVTGAILGSIKTVITINKGHYCAKWFDMVLGIFTGIVTGYYFSNEYSVYVTALISLIAGSAGAILLKTLIEMMPSTFKSYIEKRLDK